MIYTRLNRTGEIESVKAHGGGDVAEVYGGINEANPIYYKTRTLTGTLPLSYKALGKPLSDYLISGNTVQDGTPTPEAPVDVVGCGVRTENLFDGYLELGSVTASGEDYQSTIRCRTNYIGVMPDKAYTVSTPIDCIVRFVLFYDKNKAVINYDKTSSKVYTFNTPYSAKTIRIVFGYKNDSSIIISEFPSDKIMLNEGSTALPYEPYGNKIPVTCGGETKNIYIGNYPLNKSGNVADDVQYSTQMLTRRIDPETLAVLATPTTEIIAVPQLPTTAGTNTITVGTTVQPSAVSITGNIKPTTTT